MKKIITLIILSAFFFIKIQAQIVDGNTYTIGASGNYPNLSTAISALNGTSGITSGVTFKLLENQILSASQAISRPLTITADTDGANKPQMKVLLNTGVTGRHFTVFAAASHVTFQNLLILGPNATYSGGIITPKTPLTQGGGIDATAPVVINNCVIAGCINTGSGGAINANNGAGLTLNNTIISYNRAGYDATTNNWESLAGQSTTNSGGGVCAFDALTLQGGITIENNMAADNGGGIWKFNTGNFTTTGIASLVINSNAAVYGFAGGIYSLVPVSIKDASITNNTAADKGGGICSDGTSAALTLIDATVSGNKAGYDILSGTFQTVGTFNGGGVYAGNILTLQGYIKLDDNMAASNGGGIWKNNTGNFTTTGLVILSVNNNSAVNGVGGGIYSGVPVGFSNAMINVNAAGSSGGGIYAEAALTLNNSTFFGNEAGVNGGGIYANDALTFQGSINLQNNKATNQGGGLRKSGNGSFLTNNLTSLTVNQNSTTVSSSDNGGGGIYTLASLNLSLVGVVTITNNTSAGNGGGIYSGTSASLTLGIATISGNSATSGGGIFAGNASLTNTSATNNQTTNQGGGVYASSSLTLSNTNILNNNAGGNGGGLYASTSSGFTLQGTVRFENNTTLSNGGGIWIGAGSLNTSFLTSLIVNNNTSAGTGGGIHSGVSFTGNNFQITNNKAELNGGGMYTTSSIATTINNSIFENNSAKASGGGVYASSDLALSNTSITNNKAGYDYITHFRKYGMGQRRGNIYPGKHNGDSSTGNTCQ